MSDLKTIQPHVEKFANTKTWNMGNQDKMALKRVAKKSWGETLNIHCGSCVAKALKKAKNLFLEVEEVETTSKFNRADLEALKTPEIREIAKALGVKTSNTKSVLIDNILNNVIA